MKRKPWFRLFLLFVAVGVWAVWIGVASILLASCEGHAEPPKKKPSAPPSVSSSSRPLCFTRSEVEHIRAQQIRAETEIRLLQSQHRVQKKAHDAETLSLRQTIALLHLRLAQAPICPACPCTVAWATAASLGAAGIVATVALFFVGHQQGQRLCKP